MVTKKITPIIRKTRIKEEQYEICPHCNNEILEKSTFIDPDNYLYHSSCMDKGPIEYIVPMSAEELCKRLGWSSEQHE